MLERHHAALLTECLAAFFSSRALEAIIAANVGQDSKLNQLKPHFHFDNCKFAEALAYMVDQRTVIALADDPRVMWAAFGRLTHAAQDFYSHSNYVDLWLAARDGLRQTRPEDIDGLDPALLNDSGLRSGSFYLWRDFIYYVPLFKRFAKRHLVFPGSHEAMNLDDPTSGPKFAYSLVAAKQRTLAEYERVIRALQPEQIALFHGLAEHARPQDRPAPTL